jgi:hypothetical protein
VAKYLPISLQRASFIELNEKREKRKFFGKRSKLFPLYKHLNFDMNSEHVYFKVVMLYSLFGIAFAYLIRINSKLMYL